jgi:hypothetical protein
MGMELSFTGGQCHAQRLCSHRPGSVRRPRPPACLRRVRQNRLEVGSSADLSDVRRHALLRFVAEPPCYQACTHNDASGRRVSRTGRAVAVLLPGRCLRRILTRDRHRSNGVLQEVSYKVAGVCSLHCHAAIPITTVNAEPAEPAEKKNVERRQGGRHCRPPSRLSVCSAVSACSAFDLSSRRNRSTERGARRSDRPGWRGAPGSGWPRIRPSPAASRRRRTPSDPAG